MKRIALPCSCPASGQTNEPAFVAAVASRVAELREQSLEEVAKSSTANARASFLTIKQLLGAQVKMFIGLVSCSSLHSGFEASITDRCIDDVSCSDPSVLNQSCGGCSPWVQ